MIWEGFWSFGNGMASAMPFPISQETLLDYWKDLVALKHENLFLQDKTLRRDAHDVRQTKKSSGKEFRFYQVHGHVLSGPETEGLRALVEQHIGAAETGEALFFRHGKEPGFFGIIYDV